MTASLTTPSRSSTSTTKSRHGGRRGRGPLRPFTVDHFREYARNLVLDNQEFWEPEDFQLEVIEDVFDDTPEVWMVVPEGNAKTTLMGGVSLYHGDYMPDASVLLGAASRDQCEWLFNSAGGFVHRSPGLKDRFKVYDGYRRIKCLRTGGRIQVFAADDRTGDGVIPTLALLDELHRHRDMRLYRTWRGKLHKRSGQVVAISTAGEPGSEFEEIRGRFRAEAREVTRNGAHVRAASPEMVLHDWSVPADGNVDDMAEVKAANPLSTITPETLRERRRSPTMTLAHWRRFACNQPVRNTDSAIDEHEWAAAPKEEIPAGESIWLGLDLGWKWDTTAMVPLWMPEREVRVLGEPEIIVPPRDGSSTRPDVLHAALRRLHDRNPIETVVMDPQAGGEQMAAWIEDELGASVIAYSQGNASMCLAYDRFMESLREGWLSQPRHPELTRHVLNATAKLQPDGRTRFDRPSTARTARLQDRRVIDGLIAAAIVLAAAVGAWQSRVDPSALRIEAL